MGVYLFIVLIVYLVLNNIIDSTYCGFTDNDIIRKRRLKASVGIGTIIVFGLILIHNVKI